MGVVFSLFFHFSFLLQKISFYFLDVFFTFLVCLNYNVSVASEDKRMDEQQQEEEEWEGKMWIGINGQSIPKFNAEESL